MGNLNRLRRAVERALRDGPVGPDLGKLSYAERDRILFGGREGVRA